MNRLEKSILKTLSYADIFDYPMTIEEINLWLISSIKIKNQKSKIKATTQNLKSIGKDGKYIFLSGRESVVGLRLRREKHSREKIKIAGKTARWLGKIPWVKMVGVTGALAMNNSDENDDIDLLIIATPNRLWLTRLAVTILTNLVAKRRRPNSVGVPISPGGSQSSPPGCLEFYLFTRRVVLRLRHTRRVEVSACQDNVFYQNDGKTKDRICLNMFLEENYLALPKNERDLYTAHEVLQMKPLINKNQAYEKFLWENRWTEKYLPNAIGPISPGGSQSSPPGCLKQDRRYRSWNEYCQSLPIPPRFQESIRPPGRCFLGSLTEGYAYKLQKFYMRKRITTEIVLPHRIRFHPGDCRKTILREYRSKVDRLI